VSEHRGLGYGDFGIWRRVDRGRHCGKRERRKTASSYYKPHGADHVWVGDAGRVMVDASIPDTVSGLRQDRLLLMMIVWL
jgi:hypothetical protein